MATNDYTVNYEDERFAQVESDKSAALSELEQTYAGMTGESDKYYQAQIDASKQWADTQSKLQQEQTDFTIEQIEQQKAQAQKDYTKEQSGAYVDWQKQSNQYGSEAEKMAAQGLANTGFSESSQVGMYNTYQNRVATARESYNQAVLNYNNSIKEARLQNNSVLAEIAYQSLQQQLELSLQGFQYKNQLILDKYNTKLAVDNTYHQRYQEVLNQINTENAMAEEIRQYNEQMAEEKRQYNESLALQQAQLAEEQRQFNETMAYNKSKSSGGGSGGGGGSDYPILTSDEEDVEESTQPQSEYNDNRANLGLGPISDAYLAQLVYSGRVTMSKQGKTYVYKWSDKAKDEKQKVNAAKEKKILDGQQALNKYTQLRF